MMKCLWGIGKWGGRENQDKRVAMVCRDGGLIFCLRCDVFGWGLPEVTPLRAIPAGHFPLSCFSWVAMALQHDEGDGERCSVRDGWRASCGQEVEMLSSLPSYALKHV